MLRYTLLAVLTFTVLAKVPGTPGQDAPPKPVAQVQVHKTPLPGAALPFGAVARWGDVRLAHEGFVDTLAFAAGGRELLSAAGPDVHLWDAVTGKHLRVVTTRSSPARALAVAPDGKTLVVADVAGEILFWDLPSGEVLAKTLPQGPVERFVFSQDGKYVAALKHESLLVLETATGRLLRKFGSGKARIDSASFSADNKVLAIGGFGGVAFWDVSGGKELPRWPKQAGQGNQVAYTPDGRSLLILTFGRIQVWDVKQQVITNHLVAGKPWVHAFALSRDGKLLAAYGADSRIHLWEADTGRKLRVCDGEFPYGRALTFSPDGKHLALGTGHRVVVCAVATGKILNPARGHGRTVQVLAVAPDGAQVASGGLDGLVILWDRKTGQEVRRFGVPHSFPLPVSCLSYSPDGTLLAVATGTGTQDNGIWLVSPRTGTEVRQLAKGMRNIKALAFTPQGKELLAGGMDKAVRRWDVATGQELPQLTQLEHIESLAFAPEGNRLVVGQWNYQISVLDAGSGKVLRTFRPARVSLTRAGFLPDSPILATAGYDKAIRLWDVLTGEPVNVFELDANPLSFAASPDGRLLATAGLNGKVGLWEIASGRLIREFRGHRGWPWALAFTPDGRQLLSGGADTLVVVWDVDQLLAGRDLPPAQGTPKELEQWWAELADRDPTRAYPALLRLSAVPDKAVPFLARMARPSAELLRAEAWIKQLDIRQFAVREKAMVALEQLGPYAQPLMQKHLDGTPSPEVQARLEQLLAKAKEKSLQYQRAVAILERAGTVQARALLAEIAEAVPLLPLGRQANQALKRLKSS